MDFEKSLIANGYKKNKNIHVKCRQVNNVTEFIFKDKEFMIYDRHIQEFYFVSQKKYTKLSIDKLIKVFSCTTPDPTTIINNSFKIIFKSLYSLPKNYEEFQKLGLVYETQALPERISYNDPFMDIDNMNDLVLLYNDQLMDIDMLDINPIQLCSLRMSQNSGFEDIAILANPNETLANPNKKIGSLIPYASHFSIPTLVFNPNQILDNPNQTLDNPNQILDNQNKFTRNDFFQITEQDTKSTTSLSDGVLNIYLTENCICGLITYEWTLYHKKTLQENSIRFVLGE